MKSQCTECKAVLNLSEKHLGHRVKCPRCGQPFLVDEWTGEPVEEVREEAPPPSRPRSTRRQLVDREVAREHVESAARGAKVTAEATWGALRKLLVNPVGGLEEAYRGLQAGRAAGVGVGFGLVFDMLVIGGLVMGMRPLLKELGAASSGPSVSHEGSLPPELWLKLLALGLVPLASLAVALAAFRLILRGRGTFGSDLFIAGAALLPMGAAAFLSGVVGIANLEVIVAASVVGQCLTIMMLFAGLTRVCGISERAASLAVPLALLASAWVAKILAVALLT